MRVGRWKHEAGNKTESDCAHYVAGMVASGSRGRRAGPID